MARKLEVEIVGDASSLNRTLKQSADSTGRFNKHLGALKVAAFGAGAAVGGALVVGLKDSISAGIEAQKSQARLAVAFKNAGKAIGPYEKQIGQAEKASRKLGFTDDETRQSLGSLITVTHNYKQATKEMAIAQNLARFKGVSLEQAVKALTMAHAGSLRAIKQLGLDVPKVTDAQDRLKSVTKDHTTEAYKNALAEAKQADKAATLKNVLETVTNATKGQAKAYAGTAAGAMQTFHAELQHIEEEIGLKLLPVMTNAIVFIRDHWPQISKAITQAWAQIKPTLVALEDLVISVVKVIRDHWSTIGPIVMDVVKVVRAQLAIITGVIRVFAALLRGDWSGAWNALKDTVSAVFAEIKGILNTQKDILLAVAKGIGTAIWQGLKSGFEAGLGAIKDAVTGLFHKVIGWAESALGIASPSKVFHGIGQNAVKGFIHGVGSMGGDLKKAVIKIAENAATSIYHAAGGLLHGGAATGSGRNRNIGQQLAAKYGWGAGAQWANLDALWQQESGWSNTAKNPSSGAYGIAQALPPTKMPFAAQEAGGSNAAAQIAWGLSYIKNRYGSPIAAMAHEQSVGWYDKGGVVPGSGPQLAVVHGGETIVPTHKKLSHHIDDIASNFVKWSSQAKRFTLFNGYDSPRVGIPTQRMLRDWFNHYGTAFGGHINTNYVRNNIIPWWEREGFFEQLASRKAIKKFDRGGWIPPGLSLAMNGTGRPERVVGPGGGGAPMVVNLVLDGKILASQLIDPLRGQSQIYKQRTGRQAFA